MFSRDRDRTHKSGTPSGISPAFTTSSLCLFQRNLILGYHCRGRGINISGVDFWHAVEFSRNGRFLRTHPLGLSSGQFPFGLAFPTLSDRFRSDSLSEGFASRLRAFALRPFDIHYASRFPPQLIIEFH